MNEIIGGGEIGELGGLFIAFSFMWSEGKFGGWCSTDMQ